MSVCTVCETVTFVSTKFNSLEVVVGVVVAVVAVAEADDLLKLHLFFSFGVEEVGVVEFSVPFEEQFRLVVDFPFSFSLSFLPVNKFLSHLPVFPISFKHPSSKLILDTSK